VRPAYDRLEIVKKESLLTIRQLTREELELAVDWAVEEGWNPGLHDAEVFWKTDPEGFIGAELDGELVGTGSIVSYDGDYGFMGFFIIKKGLRGQGLGTKLWHYRRDLLKSRLSSDRAIGMDGVFEMQDWYARGGFEFSHRNLRMQGTGASGEIASEIVPLTEVPFDRISAYDRQCFGCEREVFLKEWIAMPDVTALGFEEEGRLRGYGVIRKCREGFKIGPLFADSANVSGSLFVALSGAAVGEALFLDIPECNAEAVELARRHHMEEVFGCARMYCGPPNEMVWDKIYGITTFELG